MVTGVAIGLGGLVISLLQWVLGELEVHPLRRRSRRSDDTPSEASTNHSQVLVADPAIEQRRVRALIADLRNHASEIERFREAMLLRLSHAGAGENGDVRRAYEREHQQSGLVDRSQAMYAAGREWGFFHPSSDEHIFGPLFNTGTLRFRAERMREFANHLQEPADGTARVSVTSHHQSGGITAATVTMGSRIERAISE